MRTVVPWACVMFAACDPAQIAARAGCRLEGAVVCDGFEQEYPGGRGGPLDEQRWQVTRFSHIANVPQGQHNSWVPGQGVGCGGTRDGLVPTDDVFMCDGRLHDVLTAGGSYAIHDLSLRQPFDFAGRTGTVTFSLGGQALDIGWWPEIWLTEAPRQIPEIHESTGNEPTLERGVGLVLRPEWCGPELKTVVSYVTVVDGYVISRFARAQLEVSDCFDVGEGVLNRFALRVSQSRLELEVTPPGGAPRLVAAMPVSLPFTRGYLHFEQAMWGSTQASTFVWDDVGFDGPRLPAWTAYELPDPKGPAPQLPPGSVNVGFPLVDPLTVTLPGVQLQGRSEALLAFTFGLYPPFELQSRWNGGAWVVHPDPSPGFVHGWRAMLLPVPFGELREGDNTLELRTTVVDGFAHVANVELLLR